MTVRDGNHRPISLFNITGQIRTLTIGYPTLQSVLLPYGNMASVLDFLLHRYRHNDAPSIDWRRMYSIRNTLCVVA